METNQLQISSKTESLTQVESLVDEVCEGLHVSQDYYGNILIALTEAVTNAIQHGNRFDPSKAIDVKYEPHENDIEFVVRDQGEGFDFNNLPDPTDPKNIEKPHGRGIFLMKHLADEVAFEDHGRVVKLKFNLSAN